MSNRTCTIDGCANTHRARGLCSTHYNQARYTQYDRHPVHIVACVICGTMVSRAVQSKYQPTCSVECRSIVQCGAMSAQRSANGWRSDAESRARRAGCEIVESFDRTEVFDRDDWLCQRCGIPCSQPDPFDKTAATIDHIIPFANKGAHSRANTQTLCLSCNSAKRDRVAA